MKEIRLRVTGPLGAPTGFGQACHDMLMSLLRAGLDIEIDPILPPQMNVLEERYMELGALTRHVDDDWPTHYLVHCSPAFADKLARDEMAPKLGVPRILYTTWETDRVPRHLAYKIDANYHHVVVPSEHNREAFAAGGIPREKIHVIPHGVDPSWWKASEDTTPALPARADASATPGPLTRASHCTTPVIGTRAVVNATSDMQTRADDPAAPRAQSRAADVATPGGCARAAASAPPDVEAQADIGRHPNAACEPSSSRHPSSRCEPVSGRHPMDQRESYAQQHPCDEREPCAPRHPTANREPDPSRHPMQNRVYTEPYIFYSVLTWCERKNPIGLLKAYFAEFTARDNVDLVIVSTLGISSDDVEALKVAMRLPIDELPPVHFVVGPTRVTDRNMLDLHQGADCYISLTRGEGFGLPLLEAALVGNPVIVTKWGGHRDFLDNYVHAMYIDTMFAPAFPGSHSLDAGFIRPDQRWAEPDLAGAMRAMRRAYELRLGKRPEAAEPLFARLNYDVVGRMWRDLLETV